MPLLHVQSVSKSFGALRAVDDVSFKVEAGRTFGIAGPNGSGKSTLFNILTGIPFRPDSGKVLLDGKEIQHRPAHEIVRLGMVRSFQRETGFDSLSVYENALMAATFGRSGQVRPDEVAEALTFTGLRTSDFGRPAQELSVYDRKCLMLATAIATRPRLLLLDEPASGLTKPEVEQAIALVRRISERGITVLLIEHVLPFLMSLSQSLMVLNQGRVLATGEPETVMRDPRVVEAYLGSRRHKA